jgi:hypothetical protein
VRKTLIEHKLLGQPIVVDDGDGPRWIPAEEIEIPPPVDDLPDLPGHLSTP